MKCEHWIGPRGRYCRIPGARAYIQGPRCPLHTPAALAGRAEPGSPGPAPVEEPAAIEGGPP